MTTPTTDPTRGRVRRRWDDLVLAVSWTTPTSTEIGVVVKSALAAGLAWATAQRISGVHDPVLASLSALVVVQVSVRASIRTAIERSAAVVVGVLVAVAVGDALSLNALTVALVIAASLGVAELLLRLPPSAARQIPNSIMVVLAAAGSNQSTSGWQRATDTVVGAVVGVGVSLLLPASRLVDARQTLDRLAGSLGELLESMGTGLEQPWSTEQTEEWRHKARTTRVRLVDQAVEAIGNGREAAMWNIRDRRHVDELGRYEEVMPRLERTAIGVSVISRGLDDQARLSGTTHPGMPAMGALLVALSDAVRTLVHVVLGQSEPPDLQRSVAEVRTQRARCVRGATRRARWAIEHGDEPEADRAENEWLGYAALLVQVDRLVVDLSAPLPP